MCETTDYVVWLNSLKEIAHRKFGYSTDYNFSYDQWKNAYREGLTPEEAIIQEYSYLDVLSDTPDCKVLD
jgi:hypothetical protein